MTDLDDWDGTSYKHIERERKAKSRLPEEASDERE